MKNRFPCFIFLSCIYKIKFEKNVIKTDINKTKIRFGEIKKEKNEIKNCENENK